MRTLTLSLLTVSTLLASSLASAAEVSLVSGLYKSEETEIADNDAGKITTIGAGGRFSDQLDSRMYWFGQGMLTMRSYDKGDNEDAPSDSTSLALGGGGRYYSTKLAESVSPFAYGLGQYKSDKTASGTGSGFTETEDNGLFYGASFGIRLSLDTDFFVDFESELFESALFATRKTETTSYATGTKVTSKDETKRTELWVQSSGPFENMIIALGMRI
jgi:hypothetical protein